MESEGRKIHAQAEQARENGDFGKALELTDQAMLAYQQASDKLGFAEVQASRYLSLNHLYKKTNDKDYLILAKHAAMASVELAEVSGDKTALAIPQFNLAKSQEELGDFKSAVTTYRLAVLNIKNNPPQTHNRPGVVADFEVHLAVCEYKSGDKAALTRAEEALANLEESGEDKVSAYNYHVWLSGAHMRIAWMLKDDNHNKAMEHLQKAKEIIDSDPRLTLRLEQWQKLSKKLNKV